MWLGLGTECSHLKPQASSRKRTLEIPKVVSSDIILPVRPYIISLSKQLPTRNGIFKCPRMWGASHQTTTESEWTAQLAMVTLIQ